MHGERGPRRHSSKMVLIPLPWGYSRRVPAGWVILGGLGLGVVMRMTRSGSADEEPATKAD